MNLSKSLNHVVLFSIDICIKIITNEEWNYLCLASSFVLIVGIIIQ